MSLHPKTVDPVPEQTARVARAAFSKGNLYMTMRDEFGALFEDSQFADLFPTRGQPAQAPWRLALVTVMQFAEGLSDRQAADAVRSRIDWKYALSLELEDPGFDASVLCEFRTRLVEGTAEERLLDTLLERFRERRLLKARGRQRTDSTHVLAAVRALNRVALVAETMRHALDTLATAAPDWLRVHAQPEWIERYGRRAQDERLPAKQKERVALAQTIGADGQALLCAVWAAEAPAWLRDLPAIETLRRVWVQNYLQTQEGLHFRDAPDLPPARQFISSPYDPDAHLGKKGSTCWVGYKVHLTETCEDDLPNLIMHVETTSAPAADGEVTPRVHEALQAKGLLPATHVVDTGYLDAQLLVTSKRDFEVDLLGPTRPDVKWQAREGQGFAAANFRIDWERQEATCPEGRTSISWTPAVDKGHNEVVKIKFSTTDCGACPSRERCVRSQKKYVRRTVTLRRQDYHQALTAARERERTQQYQEEYAWPAGVEGTLSRGVRRCRLRRSPYLGQVKVHLGNLLSATALNFLRVGEWLMGMPKPETRISGFARLMAPLAPAS